MTETKLFDTPQLVAESAARQTILILQSAVEKNGQAVWVLAGGSSPMAAYQIIAAGSQDDLDWSKVTVLIGDERCVPPGHVDSNWGAISKVLLTGSETSKATQLVPQTDLSPEEAAINYSRQIQDDAINSFDVVWLGVGEDGHTLSLFPENPGFFDETDELVIAVHDSPKPPSDRISLSLSSMKMTKNAFIFAVGAGKKDALTKVRSGENLPIGVVAKNIENTGGIVTWLYDQAAS